MGLLYAEIPLSEVILNEPTLIPVINRFGITLGTQEKSISEICREKGLDADFFLTILNTFVNDSFFPEKKLKSFCASQIVDYLSQTNSYYVRYQLPNIERHFSLLIEKSPLQNNNLELIRQFFLELKQELLLRIENDEKEWFPQIKRLSENIHPETAVTSCCSNDTELNPVEEKLNDLKSLFVRHLSGDYNLNLCYGVIFAIFSLEKDIKQNNRIRNRILKPLYHSMLQIQTPEKL
ncbi:MAG: helix-turn-helix transcriptional regulator [Coprobacter sp.]|nr:helix-turn-helix transcriptional regulator [Coprobacter sp.]